MNKFSVIFLSLVVSASSIYAQERAEETTPTTAKPVNPEEGYNKHSIRPIHESDIMYKKSKSQNF
jgi:hypothetical protein